MLNRIGCVDWYGCDILLWKRHTEALKLPIAVTVFSDKLRARLT